MLQEMLHVGHRPNFVENFLIQKIYLLKSLNMLLFQIKKK